MNGAPGNPSKMIYWHRDLPPLDAEVLGEHTVEANSNRVAGDLAHREELWDQCYRQLMTNAERNLLQEVVRLRGDYAHVHSEALTPKHDHVAGEAWLHGVFTYTLYKSVSKARQGTNA